MSKRINSYQAVAAFVRGFFEAYARGIIDATIEGNDFSKKNDPKQIKQMMLEHYGEVNQYFFDIMFSTLVRLNYKTAEEANERMKKNFDSMKQADPTFEPTMLDYLRIACKSNQLYKAMESEYRHRYEVNNDYRKVLVENGMQLSGISPDGRIVEMIEIKEHPWFLATQAHPELKSRPNRPHPLFRGFIGAALEYQEKNN